jgi:hypothetical protein
MASDDYPAGPVSRASLRGTADRLVTVASYEARLQELFGLVRKRAALDTTSATPDRTRTGEYEALVSRIEAPESELSTIVDGMDTTQFASVLCRTSA